MRLFPDGDRIFEVISRYDDLLTIEEREDYEPGDTLALLVSLAFGQMFDLSQAQIDGASEDLEAVGWAAQGRFTSPDFLSSDDPVFRQGFVPF